MMKITEDMFVEVDMFNPPKKDIEILAKSPSGILHLTSWRSAHNIFSCMDKTDDISGWSYIEIDKTL